MDLMNHLIGAMIQVILFSLVPLIFYLIKHKKIKGFFDFIGIKKINESWVLKSIIISLIAGIFSLFPLIYIKTTGGFNSGLLATNSFMNKEFGLGLILEIFIYAFIRTAMSEEILFRGFIAKRLMNRLGFVKGNLIHSFIFGIIHGIVFIQYGILAVIISILLPSIIGYIFTWNNEKNCNGSIISSWLIHGISNVIGPILIMFII